MRPLGQKPTRFPSKVDCHPPKGHINWWETAMCTINKVAEKLTSKKDITEQLKDSQ